MKKPSLLIQNTELKLEIVQPKFSNKAVLTPNNKDPDCTIKDLYILLSLLCEHQLNTRCEIADWFYQSASRTTVVCIGFLYKIVCFFIAYPHICKSKFEMQQACAQNHCARTFIRKWKYVFSLFNTGKLFIRVRDGYYD